MANKIVEVIVEPSKVFVNTKFLLKVKAIRYLTYEEIKTKTYTEIKNEFTYREMEGG